MTPAKALRLGLAEAGEEVLQAAISVGTVEEARTTVPRLPERIGEGALAVLLDSSSAPRGLAILDAGALAAVLEALTTGRVSEGGPAPSPRKPTATDAFLCSRFLSRAVEAFAKHLETLPESGWPKGYSAAEQLRDPRNLPLLLEDVAFRAIAAPLVFGPGAREGRLELVLPWITPRPALRALPAPEQPVEETLKDAPEPTDNSECLGSAELSLEVVLHRLRLPLERLAALKPGDHLPFPVHAVGSVSLVDAAGVQVAQGQLGQAKGHRAVKLTTSSDRMDDGLAPLTVTASERQPTKGQVVENDLAGDHGELRTVSDIPPSPGDLPVPADALDNTDPPQE